MDLGGIGGPPYNYLGLKMKGDGITEMGRKGEGDERGKEG